MNTGTIGLNRTPSTALFRGRHTDDASRLTSRNHTPASTPITTSRTFQFEDDQQRRQPATSRAFNEGNSERFRPPENRRLPADSSAQSVSNRLFMLQRFAMTGTMETAQFPTDGDGEDPSYHHQHYSPKGDRSERLPTEEACNDSEKDNSGFFTHSSARSNKVAIASSAPVPAPTTVVVRLADLSADLKEAFISELLVEVDDASIAFAKGPASQMIANVSISRGSEKINQNNNNNAPHRRIEESNRQGSVSTLRVFELVEMAAKQKSEQLAQRMREGRTLLEEAREEITQRRNQQPLSSSIPTATGSLMGHIQPQKDHQAVNDAQSSQNATLSTVASGWQHQQEILHHHHRQQHVPLMTSRNASIIEESQRVLLESSAILASSVLADNTSTQHSEREPTRGTAERRAAGTYNNSGHDVHYETQITKPYRHQRRHVEAREQREEEDEGAHVARRPKHNAAAVFFGDEAMPAPTPTPAPSPTPQHAHYVSPKRQHYYHPQQSKQEHGRLVLRRDHTSLNNVSPAEEKLGLRVPTAAEKARAAAKEARETYELPASFLVSGGTSKEEISEMKGNNMSEEWQINRQKQKEDSSNKKHPLSPSRRRQEETRPVDVSSSSASVRGAADATTRSTKSTHHHNQTAGRVAKVTSSTTARNPIPLRSSSSSSRPNSRSRTRDPTPTRKPSPRPQAHGEERPPSRASSARQTATPAHAANEGRRSASATRRNFAADASTILATHFSDGRQLSGLKLSAEDQKRHASTATTRTAAWLAKQADEIFTLIHKTVLPARERLNEILRHEERRWGLRSKQFIVTTDNNDAQSAVNRSRSRDPELRTGGERGRGESKGPTLASCLLYVSPQPPTLFSAIVRHLVSARCGIDSVVSSTIDELAHNAQKFSKVCPTANILHYFFETCRDDDILEQLLLFIAMRHKTLPFASSETQKVTARAVPLRSFTREVGDQTEGEVSSIYSLEPLTVAESARYDARRGNSRNQYQQHLILRRYVPLGKVPAAVKAMLEDLQPQPFSSSHQGNAAGPSLPPPSGNVSINDSVLAAATKETGDPATPSRRRAHSVSNGTTDHAFVVTSPFRDRQPFLYPSSERNTLTQHINAKESSSSSAFFMNTTIVSSGQPLQQQQQMAVVPIMISGQSPTRRLRAANNEMSNNTSNHLMNNVVVAEEGGYTAACVLKQRVSAIKASIASWISDELQIVEKSQRIAEINRGGAGQGRGGAHHAENEEEKKRLFIGEDEEEPSIAFDLAGHVDAVELVRAVVAERLNKWSGSDGGDATVRGQRKEEEPATVTEGAATGGKVTNNDYDGTAYNSAVSELCHPSTSSPSSPLLKSSSSPPPAQHSISKDAILSSLPSSDKRDNVSGVGSDSIFSSRPHQPVSGDKRDHRVEAGKEIQSENSSQSKEGGGHFVHLGESSRSVSERRAIENAEAVTRARFLSHSSIPLTNVPHIEERENMNKYKDMFKVGSQQPCLSSPQRKRTERKYSRDQSPTRTWELSGSAAMSIAEERRLQNTARGHSSFVDHRDLPSLNTELSQRFTQALTAANDVSPPPPALPTVKTDKSSVVEHTNPILADARSMQALRSELRRAQSVLSSEPSSSFYQASGPTQQPKSQRTTLQGDDGPSFPSSTRRPSPVPEGGKEQGSLPKATKQIREDAAENTAIRAKEQHSRQELAKLIHENNLFGAFSASRKNDVDLHVEREGEKGAASLAAGVPSVRRTVSISPHRNVTEYKTTDRPVDLHSQQERGRGPIYADSSSVVSRYNDDDRSPDAKRDSTYSTHNKWHLKAKNTETASVGSQRSLEAEVHVDEDTDKRYNKSTLPTSTDQYSFLDRRFYQRAPLSPSASQPSVGPNEGGRVSPASLTFSLEDENRVPGRREASGERWRSVMRAEGDVNYTSTELSARVGRSQSRMNFDGFAPQYAYERKGSANGVGMMRQPSSPSDRHRSSPSDTYYSNPYEHFASISPYH